MELQQKLILKYDGGMTDEHIIDAIRFGQSLQGIGRLYASVGHFLFTGNVLKKGQQSLVRVNATESGAGCYEIGALLTTLGAHNDLFFSHSVDAYKWLLRKIIEVVHDEGTGRADYEKKAGEIMDEAKKNHSVNDILAQGAIDNQAALIQAMKEISLNSQSHLKHAVSPVGKDCKTLTQFETITTTEVDADADAIRSTQDLTVGDMQSFFCEKIKSLDTDTGACKLKIKNIEGIILGKITDPILIMPHNVYSTALDMHTPLTIKAKPHLKNDTICKLYICDAEQDLK